MKPYNNGTKKIKGKYGMISITPYIYAVMKMLGNLETKGSPSILPET